MNDEYHPSSVKRIKRKISKFKQFCAKYKKNSEKREFPPKPLPTNQQSSFWEKLKTLVMSNTWLKLSSVVFPCFVILLDMGYSDTMVMYRMYSYISTLRRDLKAVLLGMVCLLVIIYIISLVSMMNLSSLTSLKTSYSTSLQMVDVGKERASTHIPLGRKILINKIIKEPFLI